MNIKLFFLAFVNTCVSPLFFKIPNDRERCYLDEFLADSVMVVKYEIKIESKSDKGKIDT